MCSEFSTYVKGPGAEYSQTLHFVCKVFAMGCQNVRLKWVVTVVTLFLYWDTLVYVWWSDGHIVRGWTRSSKKCAILRIYRRKIKQLESQNTKAFLTNKIQYYPQKYIIAKERQLWLRMFFPFPQTQEIVCCALINTSQTLETFYCESYLYSLSRTSSYIYLKVYIFLHDP